MKKLLLTLLVLLSLSTLSAQPRGSHGSIQTPPPATPSIVFESRYGETFQVYLNGDLMNNVPRTQVVVDNLDGYMQEAIVILTHPARKAAIIQVFATMEGTPVFVNYDDRNQQLSLQTTHRDDYVYDGQPAVMPPTPSIPPTSPVIEPPAPATVSDAWVDEMIVLINRQSFDKEKLSTARGLLSNGLPFTAAQIARITSTMTFSSTQVDFLKDAYLHCYDPENYEHALAVLTFSTDRQKVRTYIASLR